MATLLRHFNGLAAGQIVKRNGLLHDDPVILRVCLVVLSVSNRFPHQHLKRSGKADLSACISGSRAHIDEPVCRHHGLGIMLHHHHRVTLIAQLLQRCDQLPVVPLVQSDRRFVKNIEHIDQFGTDLGSQPDSLAFST